MWHSLSGRSAFHTHDLHERYGPVVRLTPNHLSFTDVRAWRDIYGHRIAAPLSDTGRASSESKSSSTDSNQSPDENPKSPIHYGFLDDFPPSILVAPREEHSLVRKALSHGFSERALRSQEPRIKRCVDFLMMRIGQHAQETGKVDMGKWYNWVAFDIVGDLVFAESFGCLEKEEYHPFVKLILGTLRGGSVLIVLHYLGLGFIMRLAWKLGVRKFVVGLREQLGEKIEKRIERGNGGVEDLFEGLMRHRVEWVSCFVCSFSTSFLGGKAVC